MSPIGLRNAPSPDDDSWVFRATIPTSRRVGMGKHITFSPQQIKLDLTLFPANRMLQEDDPNKFVLASFEQLRFPEKPASVAREYMLRFFKAGLLLNGVHYRFYGHSNSQLRSRSCFLREANTDDELDDRIYRLGDFQRIMNAAKRAKRIGLLFSEAKMDWILDPLWTKDIDDITSEGEVFSDGCGLISTKFAVLLSKNKRIIFRGKGYTPCVYQIRYRGYKGVLMIHPLREDHVHFRKSQKKFTATGNNTFSVVNYSVPYAFARLNNDIVVLLSSLGVTTEKFVAKQREYFQWITEASTEWEVAFDFLSALGKYDLAERVLLDGMDDDRIQGEIHRLQRVEMASFKKNERLRVRTLVQKSRFLFGVCDPYGVLKPGEVHVRLTIPRKGAASLTNVDVLVVRNPCLHPGDCLKLRAVRHLKLDHLVDCLVFSSRGKRAAPSMSSGGDLDGDQFTVIWDPELVPPKVAESYTYPPGREHISNNITRQDLAKHFAAYNSMMLGRITTLHQRWMRISPKGAMCAECQELNALHSSVVDGGSIKIPERLSNIPDTPEDAPPFVLDVLHEEARHFCEEYEQQNPEHGIYGEFTIDEAEEMIARLLSSSRSAVSEYEVLMNAAALAKKHSIDISRFLCHVDFGALTTAEKHAASIILKLSPEQHPYIWNSLVRSDILQRVDLESRDLGGPLRLQRLYTSQQQGRAAFFEYLREAVQDYNRRLIVIKMDARFSVGIFLRGEIAWEDEPEVNDNVLVCSFMPYSSTSTSSYKRSTKGYKLHCSENTFQLYNHQRGDTFIFITRPPAKSGVDIITSIALQKISAHVLKQCGRVNRTPVTDIEIHVVSNRDRVGQQMFDLRFEYVETEEYMRRFDHRPQTYVPSTLLGLDWSNFPDEARIIFTNHQGIVQRLLSTLTDTDLYKHLVFAINYRAEDRAFWIFEALVSKDSLSIDLICQSMDLYPDLAFLLLKRSFLEGGGVPQDTVEELASSTIKNIIRSANHLAVASLVGLEKMAQIIDSLDISQYFQLLWLSCLSVRSSSLVQEVLLVLQECRETSRTQSAISEYAHKHGMAIVFDRAEEASDSCPCDEGGRPKRSRREKPTRAKLQPPKTTTDSDNPSASGKNQSSDNSTLPATITMIPPQRVMAHIRVDAPSSIRIHSHVRMQVVSPPEHSTLPPAVLDATVIRASRGEVLLEPLHPLPPEYASVDWSLYSAGSVATSKAMLDAVQKLAMERSDCCSFYDVITGAAEPLDQDETILDEEAEGDGADSALNESQRQAISLARAGRMTLIWGPPGTGKTTVVVRILVKFLSIYPEARILMTASTHNAVDNVLERFISINTQLNILTDEQILRAATESSKVNKSLQKYTIDARLGGNINDDPRLIQKATKRIKDAKIIFTTCSGAGLGIIRNAEFDIVLVDEASQITEPGALIPLVKGCRTAVLVGDHVQLRPTVRPMGKALEFDKSLFERLYTGPAYINLSRIMLDTQYRFSADVASFPSREFYDNRLRTGTPRDDEITSKLGPSSFPWPIKQNDNISPVVFVQCSAEEDFGKSSKGNEGQVKLVKHIFSLLRTPRPLNQPSPDVAETSTTLKNIERKLAEISVAILTPYSRQLKLLTSELSNNVNIEKSTIDSFQGRESDIIIFSTVRCNLEGDIGFVEDMRRLNVAWTRPKLGLIIVGDERTLAGHCPLWDRAVKSCEKVVIDIPSEEV